MKNIKLRVWDKEKKEFVTDEVFLDIDGNGYFLGDLPNGSIGDATGIKERSGFSFKRFIFQKATGFKDVKGKKIYFGDTVRKCLEEEGGSWWYAKVEFINGCTVLKEIGFNYSDVYFPEDYTFLYSEAESCEIIN